MKPMIKIKRKVSVVIGILFALSFFLALAQPVKADNHDVLDQANVINAETEAKIKDINETKLSKIKGKPQIAVVTRDSLKGTGCKDIDEYGQKLFDKYKFGTKGYDNGVLIVLLIKDHRFRIQTGYGVESVIPDVYAHKVMSNPKVKKSFKKSDYSQGVEIMTDKLTTRLETHQKDLRSKSDVKKHAKKDLLFYWIIGIILIGMPLAFAVFLLFDDGFGSADSSGSGSSFGSSSWSSGGDSFGGGGGFSGGGGASGSW